MNNLYDEIYKNPEAFGGNPDELLILLTEIAHKPLSLYEFGAGNGRNSLFAASKGFQVIASDISNVGLSNIKDKAYSLNLTIATEIFNIGSTELEDNFDAFLCSYTFHHIDSNQVALFVEEMKAHTNLGGFNLITTFTTNSDFFLKNPQTSKFYDGGADLEKLYEDWQIVKVVTFRTKSLQKSESGESYENEVKSILVRKKDPGSSPE